MRQILPFSSIRTITVGFGIAPNLLTPPIARRALAGFGDRSPLPPVGTFTPPRERDRRELRPTQLTHLWPIHATHLRRVPRGIFPIYKKEGHSFAALRGFRETEQFEAIQQSAARFFATLGRMQRVT